MEYDFAIVYWGLTRSTKQVYTSHYQHIFKVLEKKGSTFKKFMHTWQIEGNKQKVWGEVSKKEIDYEEYKLLKIDNYCIDSQDTFLNSLNMDDFFNEELYISKGVCEQGEWHPYLIQNHLCALESLKRSLALVEDDISRGNRFKFIMFVRPDARFRNSLPLDKILPFPTKVHIADFDHVDGFNDRFVVTNVENASIYGKRINEIAEYRKNVGSISSERYLKYILNKYKVDINLIPLKFDLVRPN